MANIPVVSPVTGTIINNRYTRLYSNPHFDYLTEMLPKEIKELFKWCELVYNNMPVIANGIRKLINYPVTDFTYNSDSTVIRDKTKELVKTMKLKSILLDFGNDYYVYGNVFRSIYMPFRRFLKCNSCHEEISVERCDFRIRGDKIQVKCTNCGSYKNCDLVDRPTHSTSNIRVVRWDPKQIELAHNPITGSISYFYDLPQEFRNAVKKAELSAFLDTPKIFIEAALAGKKITLGNNFYHAKTPGLSGFATGWGIPPLLSTLKGYMYTAVLRRAAESIGMEHITPQRILFPQAASGVDPSLGASLDRWKREITSAMERWRTDPNYVMTAPYPTGITNIGSQGRQLIPTEEIKDARMEMALALDIPPGIIMGDTTMQNSAVALRILENQLTPYVQQLTDFTNWLIMQINANLGHTYCELDLVPFKIADDIMNKQILMQLMGQSVSKRTIQEILSLDPDAERDRIIQDQVAEHDMQKEVESIIQKKEESAAAQVQEEQSGMPSPYNQQKMLAQAQQIAMQLAQMPYEQRRSAMAQLQNEDYVMWALARAQLESLGNQQQEMQ